MIFCLKFNWASIYTCVFLSIFHCWSHLKNDFTSFLTSYFSLAFVNINRKLSAILITRYFSLILLLKHYFRLFFFFCFPISELRNKEKVEEKLYLWNGTCQFLVGYKDHPLSNTLCHTHTVCVFWKAIRHNLKFKLIRNDKTME